MYENLNGQPEPGTLMESLILLVWRARQEIKMRETRSIVHAVIAASATGDAVKSADDKMQEAWADYLDAIFPFQKGKRKRADKAALEFFKGEVQKGPMVVKPLQSLQRGSSKLRRTKSSNKDSGRLKPRYRRKRRGR